MRRDTLSFGLLFLAAGWLVAPVAAAEERTADKIVADIDALKMPEVTPEIRSDREAAMKFIEARQKVMLRKSELVKELAKADPENKKLEQLLPERWGIILSSRDAKAALELRAELDATLAKSKSEKLKTEASFYLAIGALQRAIGGGGDADAAVKALDAFVARAPKDERAGELLWVIASRIETAKDKKLKLYKRVIAEYPESQFVESARDAMRIAEAIGKPFELSFKDAIKGTEISMKDLKGKVVVIDFWATWCGPCVNEMPNMKKLYSEYKDKGVEFIGVSLDQPKEKGGLDRLKDFVEKNKIAWPQYYQGNYWNSEFSKSWGINSIPCVFIVDADGNLYSTDARGQLEELIPELLKKAGAKAPAGASGN